METKYIFVETSKFLKRPSFLCQKYVNQKYLLHSRTSLEPYKSIVKKIGFSVRFLTRFLSHLKFGKMKDTKI